MSDTGAVAAVASEPASKAAKKPRKAGAIKPKKAADHPKYSAMIKDAITALKERGGSSRQAILKYILKHNHLGQDEKMVNAHLKLALRAGIKNNTLKQSKGTGASGSFRLGEKKTAEKKPKAAVKPKKAVAKPKKAAGSPKKPKAKKPKAAGSPKKAAKPKAAKPKVAKATKPKAAAKPKSPKKTKVAKPKVAKSPKAKKPKAAAKPKKAAKK